MQSWQHFINIHTATFATLIFARKVAHISIVTATKISLHYSAFSSTGVRSRAFSPVIDHPTRNFYLTTCKARINMNPGESDDKEKMLSVQDLRLKRLAALGILQPQNIVLNKSTDDSVKMARDNQSKQQIIDLLDASSSDEDDSTAIRKKNPSTHILKRGAKEITILDSSGDDSTNEDFNLNAQGPEQRKKKSSKSLDQPQSTKSKRLNTASFQQSTNSSPESRSTWKFQVASWNVWFGTKGDGSPHPAPRMRTLVKLLTEQSTKDNPLLFIGLQEVIDPLAVFLIPALESAGYRVFRQQGAAYGCAIAIDNRMEIISHSWHPYSQTVMQRGFYQVRAKLPNKYSPTDTPEVVFTTTHLESWTGPDYTGAAQRVPQLQEMEEYCNRQVSSSSSKAYMAIMTGDMNWDDERPRSVPVDPLMPTVLHESIHWQDAWKVAASSTDKKFGYTYDAKINPMLGGNLRRRFDRCLTRSSMNDLGKWKVTPLHTVLLGQNAISDLKWDKYNSYKQSFTEAPTAPSDHFGLVVHLELSR